MDTFNNTVLFREHLNKFIIEYNVIGTSVAVGIGLATKDVIHSFISDILFPGFYLLAFKLNLHYFNNNKHVILYDIFLKQFITWFVIIIITFIFVQVSYKILLGIDNLKKDDKKELIMLDMNI
jgi:large-conductance mechanosensitive channel